MLSCVPRDACTGRGSRRRARVARRQLLRNVHRAAAHRPAAGLSVAAGLKRVAQSQNRRTEL